jgi:hypothetical protein
MPSYCSSFASINSVPFIGEMELYKPYFEIGDGSTSFDVVVKVPSNCYFVADSFNGAPAAGACGAPTDKNHVIEIDKTAGCTNSDETLLTVTLNYNEDPTGDPLNIYIVDKSNGDSTIGNKSKKDIRE